MERSMPDDSDAVQMQEGEEKYPAHDQPPSVILMAAAASSEIDAPVLRQSWLLAKVFSAELIVCHVVQMHTSTPGNESDGYPGNDQERQTLEKLKESAYGVIGSSANGMNIQILHGDPAERIVEYADYCSADLIVVGSSNRSGIKKAILGSVSSGIVSRSKKSVFIAKDDY
jgi:nucleotide-binding universal stress UspA family protein